MEYKQLLESHRDEVVSLLRGLVSFDSSRGEPSGEDRPFGDGVADCYRYLLEKAAADGFETFDAGGYGGHIEWRGVKDGVADPAGSEDGVSEKPADETPEPADETFGIPVHLDVVPAGEGWTADPFGGEEEGGFIYGRGTTDNKGSASVIYSAIKALKESGFVPAKNIRIIIGLDEETGWNGMDEYLSQVAPPDMGFVPDAEFPVINGEKGILNFEIAKKFTTSPEPGFHLTGITGGEAANMVPGGARAVLVFEEADSGKKRKGKASGRREASGGKGKSKNDKAFAHLREEADSYCESTKRRIVCKRAGKAFLVQAEGKSAHGAQPQSGVNAISILMDFLSRFELVDTEAREFIDFYNEKIGFETDGASLGIAMSDSPSGGLTVNAGTIRMNKDAVILTMNVRYPVTKKEEDVFGPMQPLLDAAGVGIIKGKHQPPLFFPEDDEFIRTLMDVYRNNTGDTESKPVVIGGGTYARAFSKMVAFGPVFPGEPDLMHKVDERVSTDSLMKAAAIYADAIYELTKGNL
ncbi:MAG: Sapep family Mn(2+)-dependent dipeptidase [Clostridiales Family XIII bacterium]|jgi:succinyl-diaminopimelate desuccinylase|nr:Sapep family Mn(2+)-dependent dipeptidase [Clostridiales Family XIII bacterium]